MAESKTIVVSNISPLLNESHLRDLFSCCGTLTAISLTQDNGQSVARITYATAAEAKAAAFLDQTPLGDRNLRVMIDLGLPMMQAVASAPGFAAAAPAAAPGMPLSVNAAATAARADQINRTVYIGNLSTMVDENNLRQFFAKCGEILFVKMCAGNDQVSRYAFIEFKDLNSAMTAHGLSGQQLGDRQLKVGKANNPISKPVEEAPAVTETKLEEAMRKVREAQMKITQKVEGGGSSSSGDKRSRSRSRSRERHRRDRSRDRGSRDSRDSRDSKGHRRSRSPYRPPSRRDGGRNFYNRRRYSRSRSPRRPKKQKEKGPDPHAGMMWDGFQWNPVQPSLTDKGIVPAPAR